MPSAAAAKSGRSLLRRPGKTKKALSGKSKSKSAHAAPKKSGRLSRQKKAKTTRNPLRPSTVATKLAAAAARLLRTKKTALLKRARSQSKPKTAKVIKSGAKAKKQTKAPPGKRASAASEAWYRKHGIDPNKTLKFVLNRAPFQVMFTGEKKEEYRRKKKWSNKLLHDIPSPSASKKKAGGGSSGSSGSGKKPKAKPAKKVKESDSTMAVGPNWQKKKFTHVEFRHGFFGNKKKGITTRAFVVPYRGFKLIKKFSRKYKTGFRVNFSNRPTYQVLLGKKAGE